jgi:hypothetical protein
MRASFLFFTCVIACLSAASAPGCGEAARTDQALCAFCENDGQCGGNPCFQDVSGMRFCGRACDSCPAGYSCQTVAGTAGLAQSCFPDSEACVPPLVPGGGGQEPDDAGPTALDFGTPGIIVSGPVGPTGGSVDRLVFGIAGDTRPDRCNGVYPQAIINNIFMGMRGQGVQFAVDQGDHIFNCGYNAEAFAGAQKQMSQYVSAAALLGKTVFMTMGNHECSGESQALCTLGVYGANPNYTAYMDALRTVADKPYYRFDVQTVSGLAVFLVVADDVWDDAEKSWLTQQLVDADAHAKYTFVSKHHPDGNDDHPEFQQIYDLVRQHKYTLFLTGHSHLYKRQYNDKRAIVVGFGGAPLAGGTFWGYGIVRQGADDRITVVVYDQATGNAMDSFSVAPQ